eukprot:TRINITY_DN18985_c0_g1_i2.p1 TRINITY_DN18985_c0_g1~~TRINITY_DN18985_c0_g1_i2.p1  ORF type:complete len:736 (-),score=138.24 TRINITY_DN18985_c0_g1_i2:54-2018(-)
MTGKTQPLSPSSGWGSLAGNEEIPADVCPVLVNTAKETPVVLSTAKETLVNVSTAKVTPVKMSTAKETLVQMSTAKETSVLASTANEAFALVNTSKETPVLVSTAKATPVNMSTAKEILVNVSTAKETPVKMSTAKETLVQRSTAKKTPVLASTANEAFALVNTSKETPVLVSTAKATPVNMSTAKEILVNVSTAKATPVNMSTAKEILVNVSTAKETPVKVSTAKEARVLVSTPKATPVALTTAKETVACSYSDGVRGLKAASSTPTDSLKVSQADCKDDNGAVGWTGMSETQWQTCFECFYERVCQDRALAGFFRGTKISSMTSGQMCFFKRVFRGELPQMGQDIHTIWAITDEHFDRFLQIFREVFRDYVCEKTVIEYLDELEKFRPSVTVHKSLCEKHDEFIISVLSKDGMIKCLAGVFQGTVHGHEYMPQACLDSVASCFLEALKSPNQEQTLPSNLQELHSKVYIGLAHLDWLREKLRKNPHLKQPPILETFDRAHKLLSEGLRARMEAATVRFDQVGPTGLYDGDLLAKNIDQWYRSVQTDPALKQFFGRGTGSAWSVARNQFTFIQAALMRGDQASNMDTLAKVHNCLSITHFHFDRFISYLMKFIDNEEIRDDFVCFLERYRPVVVKTMVVEQEKHEGEPRICSF